MNIQPVDSFIAKVIQLYETTIVRHGLMLVGQTMGGKTKCYQSLQKALTSLSHLEKFEKVVNKHTDLYISQLHYCDERALFMSLGWFI